MKKAAKTLHVFDLEAEHEVYHSSELGSIPIHAAYLVRMEGGECVYVCVGGVLGVMHDRSYMGINPRIPNMPGTGWGLQLPGACASEEPPAQNQKHCVTLCSFANAHITSYSPQGRFAI